MVLMELLVRASVGAVPVFVLLKIGKTPRMRRVVLVIELLVKLLMLQMIIKVVEKPCYSPGSWPKANVAGAPKTNAVAAK